MGSGFKVYKIMSWWKGERQALVDRNPAVPGHLMKLVGNQFKTDERRKCLHSR